MADNINVTPGTGKTVASEEIGAVQFQKVKIVDGTAAGTTGLLIDSAGRIYVRSVIDGTITVTGINSSIGVYFDRGEPTVKLTGNPVVNIYATGVLGNAGGVASGSTSTTGNTGLTLVSPVAGYNIKVYAIALTTTAQVHQMVSFCDGNSAGGTEFWRYGLQAPSAGIAGANLAVTPPGYLFATGINTTLAIRQATASLLHYSVAYFKESA